MRKKKFGNMHVYEVQGVVHMFKRWRDAQSYFKEHDIDMKTVIKYDSKKEYDRWMCLKMLQSDGLISNLRRQVEYELITAKTEKVKVRDKVEKVWVVENMKFRTKKEAHDYCKSIDLQCAAATCVKVLVPVYKDKIIEHNAVYTADFVYNDESGNVVVEDVKSKITKKESDYILRRKLMLDRYGIRIKET